MKITQPKQPVSLALNVDASGVGVDNSGGFWPDPATAQIIFDFIAAGGLSAYLTVIGGGKGTVQSLGNLGATETIDLANANLFLGTLNADCTIGFTGWTNGKDCQITVILTEDGTGGWEPTFTGVTWDGGTPTHTTTAGTFTRYVFTSSDGGTTIIGAKTGGTGSSALPWFNVTDYGAVNDGATDDTAAVNSAIAALNSAGFGILYFPAGTGYRITAGLTTITANCTVLGDGGSRSFPATTISCTSATATLFTVAAAEFRGLFIENTSAGATAGAGISATDAEFFRVVDCSIISFFDNVTIEDSLGWTMRGCYIAGDARYGVRVRNTAAPDTGDWSISDTYFAPGLASDAALRVESSGGGRITNCKVNGDTSGTTNGFDIEFGTGVASSIFLVSNCSIENIGGDGIKIVTTGTGSYFLIAVVGTQFGLYSNTTGHAIRVSANTLGDIKDLIFDDLLCRSTGGNTGAAITFTNVDQVRIGQIINDGFGGVWDQTGSTNVVDDTGAIAAGVNITGTPTSGQVPVASSGTAAAWGSPASLNPLTTKGDLFGFSTLAARVPIGTNGQVLTADSAQTLGLKWAAVVAALDDLTDVTLTSPAIADRLRYDGSVWRNSALIWRGMTAFDPGTGLWVPLVDGSGNQIVAEA